MAFEGGAAEVARALGGVRAGQQWKARCPVHDDRNPSLSIADGEKGVVFKCHAGCEQGDVLAKLRELEALPPSRVVDLRPERPRVVATYNYGSVRKVRFEPKSFRWEHSDGSGGWRPGRNGIDPGLYRATDLADPELKDEPVLVVEGEKDADTARKLGFVATTNPDGAGKWRDEYCALLKGKRVLVSPDRDSIGGEHCDDVLASLHRFGIDARRLDLPHGKDLTEWVEAGGKREHLDALVTAALAASNPAAANSSPAPESRGFRLLRAGDLKARSVDWLVRGYFERNSLALVFGEPGSAKTFLGISLASAIATGASWFGCRVRRGPVVCVVGEGHNGISRRFRAWFAENGGTLEDAPIFISSSSASLLEPESIAEVSSAIDEIAAKYGPPELIEFDTLARNFGPGDENSTEDMNAFIRAVDFLRAKHGSTVLILHHSGHGDKNRGRGSTVLKGAVDAEFKLERMSDGTLVLSCSKMKDSEPPAPMAFRLRGIPLDGVADEDGEPATSAVLDRVTESDAASAPAELLRDRILARLIREGRRMSTRTLFAVLQARKSDVLAELKHLHGSGRVVRHGSRAHGYEWEACNAPSGEPANAPQERPNDGGRQAEVRE